MKKKIPTIIVEETQVNKISIELKNKNLHREITRGIFNAFGGIVMALLFAVSIEQGQWLEAVLSFIFLMIILAI